MTTGRHARSVEEMSRRGAGSPSSTREPGEPEQIERPALVAGTYLVAVQAWRTNAGRVPYWIGLRTDL